MGNAKRRAGHGERTCSAPDFRDASCESAKASFSMLTHLLGLQSRSGQSVNF